MSIFSRAKRDNSSFDDDEEEVLVDEPRAKKIKDLAPENKRKRKEPVKPWGKKERIIVLVFLLLTVFIPAALAASARDWKLPGLPRITLPKFSPGDETIIIEGDNSSKKKSEEATKYFEDKTRNLSGVYALYVVRLGSGSSYGVNQTEVMQAASLIKLPVMATVYRQQEKGSIELDSKVPGADSTYRQLLGAMGHSSDNAAQVKIVTAIGKDKVQETIEEIGMERTSLEENLTTAKDIGVFFQRLWKGLIISEKNRDEMLDFLTDTIYENWIAGGISQVRVAHKYGREVHVVNDAGIVYADSPFTLVIMSRGVVEAEADGAIPEISGKIFTIETSE